MPLSRKTITHFQLKDKTGQPLTIDAFLKQLKLRSIRGTDVMALSYRSPNPQQATAVVNFLMADYLENNIRTNRASATAAREFLSKQLPEVEERVVAAEAALRRFKEKNSVGCSKRRSKDRSGKAE